MQARNPPIEKIRGLDLTLQRCGHLPVYYELIRMFFSHRISIHRICVCLWICKSTCAKVDVHSASFARQSVRMRSNSQGAVAHKSKIGAIFPRLHVKKFWFKSFDKPHCEVLLPDKTLILMIESPLITFRPVKKDKVLKMMLFTWLQTCLSPTSSLRRQRIFGSQPSLCSSRYLFNYWRHKSSNNW